MGALAVLPLALVILPRFQVTVAQRQIVESAFPVSAIIPQPESSLSFLWIVVYAVLAVVLIARIAISLFKFKKLEQGLTHASATLTERVMVLAARAREVFFCPTGEPPMTWGLLQPKIALPAESEEWIEPQLRSVVLHEDAHIRRRDWAVMIGFRLVSAIYWFNPLVWVLKMMFEQDSERAADDFVLAQGVDAPDYAGRLVEVAKTLQRRPSIVPAVTMARSNRLNGRIAAILDTKTKRGTIRGWAGLTVLATLFVGAGATALVMPVIKQIHVGAPQQKESLANRSSVATLDWSGSTSSEKSDPDLDFNLDPEEKSIELVHGPGAIQELPKSAPAPKTPSPPVANKNATAGSIKLVNHNSPRVTVDGLVELKDMNLDDVKVNIDMGAIQKEIAKGLAEADVEMKKASKDSEKDFRDAEAEIDKSDMPEAARKMAKASIAMARNMTGNLLKGNKANLESRRKMAEATKDALNKDLKQKQSDQH
jgi:beta-lactamase regulating signal transducer with metallopeptidase domain